MKRLLCSLFLLTALCVRAQHIATIAGTTVAGFSGDNGPATAAQLYGPLGIAVDSAGNIYFADRFNDRVRKINTTGIITTIAGTGTGGYNGDDIAATTAQLNDPFGVAVDNAGNVYVADHSNHRVRRISNTGIITTVAGTGTAGYNGDDIAATTAQLNEPRGVAVDKFGHLFIADQANNRVRQVTLSTGIISTIAGNGTQGFSGDGGPATAAMLNGPYAMAADTFHNLYICDVDNQRVRKINWAGTITTVAGTGVGSYNADGIPATNAQLNEPIGIAVNAGGELFIADAWNERIRKVDLSGIISTYAGIGTAGVGLDSVAATACAFYYPYGIAVNSAGNIYICDQGNQRIRRTYQAGVGVADVSKETLDVSIFPNPAPGGEFTIGIQAQQPQAVTVKIYDITGRCIFEKRAYTNSAVKCNIGVASTCVVVVTTATITVEKIVVAAD